MNKYKIVLVGPSGAGKSTFVFQISDEDHPYKSENSHFAPTIGVDFCSKIFNYQNKDYKIHIWDTAGQERFSSIVNSYFRDIDMSLLFYDINEPDCLGIIEKWINKVNLIAGEKPIIIIGNKKDKNDKEIKNIDYIYLQKYSNIIKYFEISCFDKDNINYVMDYIYNYIINDPNFDKHKCEDNVKLVKKSTFFRCC
jgi:Ras-related protein Rab-6A